MEEDLVIGHEREDADSLDIIESQLMIIGSIADLDNDLYDDCLADKVKITARAMRIIFKLQGNILKEIKA